MNDMGMNFFDVPELSLSGCNPNIDMAQAMALLNATDIPTSMMSLLNPLNVQWFLEAVPDPSISSAEILARFGLTEVIQETCLYVYLTTQGDRQKPYQGTGSALARSIELSLPILQKHTAF